MTIPKEKAVKLAAEHYTERFLGEIIKYFHECEPQKSLPIGGIGYFPVGWSEEDWWIIKCPDIFKSESIRIGGSTDYLIVHKMTGEVAIINVGCD